MEKHLEYLNQLDKNEIDSFKRTYMHNLVTMKWLKIRYLDKAKKQYLFFPDELHKHYEINELFRGFDADHSEGIDIQELINMFKDNKIALDRQDVDSIFKIIDFNGDHTLNLSEFKQSVFSDEINSQFAKVMRDLREKIEKKEEQEKKKKEANYQLQLRLGESISSQELKSQKQLDQNTKVQNKLTKFYTRQPSLTNHYFSSNNNNNQKEQISSRSNNDKNQMENKLEKKDADELDNKVQRVVPTTFSSMVEFFSYNFQRKEMIKKCKQLPSTQVGQKLNELSNLLTLNSKYSEHTIEKIQKFTNKQRFHSFNLLSDIENEHNKRLSDDQTENEKDKELDKNDSHKINKQESFKRNISYSLSPNKYQNKDQQIRSIPEIDSLEKSNIEKQNKNEEFQISQIISSPQLTSEALKSSNRLNVSQSAFQLKHPIKKKHLSSDISHSTQDKTNIQSQQQLNIASLNFLSSVNQQLPQEQPHIQITQFTPQNIQKLNFNNTKLKLKLNNLSQYQQQTNQQDLQNRAVNSSKNNRTNHQLNKLQKIINEQESIKLASIQKFIQNKPTRNQSQTSYGFKRMQIYKPLNLNSSHKIKQNDHSTTQMQSSMQNSQIEDNYKDTHLLNGSINEYSHNLYLYNNPFSKKKRSSHYMSQTITTNKQNYYNSLQNSPRMHQNSKFGSQKPSQSETQATSQVSLLDEGIYSDKNLQKQQFLFNQGSKIKIRSKQKPNSDAYFLNLPQKNENFPSNLILKQRNASLPHLIQNTPIIQQNQIQSQQNINNPSLKNLLQSDKSEQHLNNQGYIKRDQQGDQNISITNNYFVNKHIDIQKLNQDKKNMVEEIEDNNLGEKTKNQQPSQQQQNIKIPNQSYKQNVELNNFYQNYKKKLDSMTMFKSTNGQVTTPSTVNESLMATLNNFNFIQKNINNNQQEQN